MDIKRCIKNIMWNYGFTMYEELINIKTFKIFDDNSINKCTFEYMTRTYVISKDGKECTPYVGIVINGVLIQVQCIKGGYKL